MREDGGDEKKDERKEIGKQKNSRIGDQQEVEQVRYFNGEIIAGEATALGGRGPRVDAEGRVSKGQLRCYGFLTCGVHCRGDKDN